MNALCRFMDAYLRHYNRVFWIFFIAAAGLFVALTATGFKDVFALDMILGLVIIFAGVHRLGQEHLNRRLRRAQKESERTVSELLQWAHKSYDYTRGFKESHETRLFSLDSKRAKHEKKTEEQYRDTVRKIVELENKLSKLGRMLSEPAPRSGRGVQAGVSRATAPGKTSGVARAGDLRKKKAVTAPIDRAPVVEARLSDLNRNQLSAISYLRKKGRITNREYRSLFRLSDKKAYNEIMFLLQKGLIRRRGKGRNTHYVLGF